MGAKKSGMPLENREIKLFWRDIRGFCRDIPKLPEKFEKKVWVQFSFPRIANNGRVCVCVYVFLGFGQEARESSAFVLC